MANLAKSNHMMKIAIAGISGFIGNRIKTTFENKSWQVVDIPRNFTSKPENMELLTTLLEEVDVVINLRGAPIIKRHTQSYKKILWESRINTTNLLVEAMQKTKSKPKVFISTSAIGIYKPNSQTHTEQTYTVNNDFIGDLCVEWEKQANKAQEIGVRTVVVRLGVVLGKDGGVVKKLSSLFKLGLGATILPAHKPFPWIHIEDVCDSVSHFIENAHSSGVYNLCANPNTNQKHFARAFAKAVKRPLLFVVPAFALKILYGKGAEIITNNPKVESVRLAQTGYNLTYNSIDEALGQIFGVIIN
jgi:uncharacterized protein